MKSDVCITPRLAPANYYVLFVLVKVTFVVLLLSGTDWWMEGSGTSFIFGAVTGQRNADVRLFPSYSTFGIPSFFALSLKFPVFALVLIEQVYTKLIQKCF